jgi:hypothetical protein
MSLTLAAAAAPAGVNKTTLLRVIKAGKVSGTRTNTARWHVEPAELHRVYPPVTQRADTEAPHYHATAALEVEIAGLRQVGELFHGQLGVTRQERDHWAEAATVALRALPEPPKASRFRRRRRVA